MDLFLKIAPIVISFAALAIVVYKEFLARAKLSSAISQVCTMRLPKDNKAALLREILLDDIFSAAPTEQARQILNKSSAIRTELSSGDRVRVATALDSYCKDAGGVPYNPRPEDIARYFESGIFALTFYIPLLVTNSGKRNAVVSNLVLIIESIHDPSHRCAYTCFTEVDAKILLDRRKESHDAERIKSLFNGFAVGPGETARVDPWFIPISDAKGRAISVRNLAEGSYRARIFMYSTGENPVCTTNFVELKLTREGLINSFQGSEALNNVSVDNAISNAIDW